MDDVLVVGAGPAGNNAAYRLANQGYSVTVVDWRDQPGDKLCTGIAGKDCTERFPLDSPLVYRDARAARIVSPEGRVLEFEKRDVQAHIVDRVAYVASFANMAVNAGAKYVLGYRATHVASNEQCASIRITNDWESLTLTARVLVLASGFGSELTAQLGLGRVGDHVTGFQAEVVAPGVTETQVYFGSKVAPGFFAWLVPTYGGRALAGLLCRSHGHAHLDQLMLRLQAEGTITDIIKRPARWGIPLRPLPKTFGERVVAVGDVAGQVKPTTGGGIYYSLLASEVATDVLHESLLRDDLSASSLHRYEKGWKALLSRELEVGYSARRLFEGLKDCQIESIMHTIASNGLYKDLIESRSVSFDWHSGVIMKLVSHPVVLRALNFINPVLASFAAHR